MNYHRIMVTSGRGGAGKSTVAAGLAYAFALRGIKTALVDFDFAERSLDILLGCQDRIVYDLGDLLEGDRTAAGTVVCPEEIDKLYLLPGVFHMKKTPTRAEAEKIFTALEKDLDVELIILDTSSVSDASVKIGSALCDLTLMTMVPSNLSLRSTTSLFDLLHELRMHEVKLVINQFSTDVKKPNSPSIRNIIDTSGIQLIGLIPKNDTFAALQDEGISSFQSDYSKDVAKAFDNIACRLIGENKPLLDGIDLPREKLLSI